MDLKTVISASSRVLLQTGSPPQHWNSDSVGFQNETTNQITVPYTLAETVAIATICAVMSLTTIIGNVLVVVAFKIEKQLQTVSNYFLLSLAVADLAIGMISMPFFTLHLLYGYKWPLGATLCDCWLAIDYTMSNASVANLLIISFDRYFSVTRPLTYRAKRTPKRAAIMIGCAWTISILLWTPWIFAWPHIEGKRTVPPNECYIQFLKTNSYVTILTALLAFYLPVSIMTFLYYKIWRATEKRKKRLISLTADRQHNNSKRSTCSSEDESLGTSMSQRWRNSSPDLSEIESITDTFENQPEDYENKWLKALKRCCSVDKEMDYEEDNNKVNSTRSSVIKKEVPSRNNSPETSCRMSLYATALSSSVKTNSQNVDSMLLSVINEDISRSDSPETPCLIQNNSPKPSCQMSLYDTAQSNSVKTNSQMAHSDHEINSIHPVDLQKSRNTTSVQDISGTTTIGLESEGESFYDHKLDSIYLKIPNKDTSDQLPFRLYKENNVRKVEPMVESDEEEDEGNNRGSSNESSPEGTFRPLKHRTRQARHQVFRTKSDEQNGGRSTTSSMISRSRIQTLDLSSIPKNTKLARWVVDRMRTQQIKRKNSYQEKKAAKILSAILLAFIITWTPYNIFTVFQIFCEDCINGTIYAIGYSLCYLNSTINPLCYALCNVNFRTTFLRILFCRTKRNASYHRAILLQRHRRLHQLSSYSSSGSSRRAATGMTELKTSEAENEN